MERRDKENIINLNFNIKMSIYKEYLNHTSGLTLSTPGLVETLSHRRGTRTLPLKTLFLQIM